MSSPAAWPPCQAKIAPVKATPMLIHTADSIAASLVVGACGVRWTSSRSTMSRTEISARKANQIQMGTSKLAKLSRLPDDSEARTASAWGGPFTPGWGGGSPAEGPPRHWGRGHRARGRPDDDAHRGLLPFGTGAAYRRRRVRSKVSWSARVGPSRPHDGLSGRQPGHRHPERGARHIVEPHALEEHDRR